MAKKTRLDILLVEKGLVESRQKAQALIMSGKVSTTDKLLDKPGLKVDIDIPLQVQLPEHDYVSRAAFKLLGAIKEFKLELKNKICLDVGASTGGFTQVCLENGAPKVYAIDVGHNQLHWRIRSDVRVICMEGVNFRNAESSLLPESVDFCCIDTSFISLKHILPSVLKFLNTKKDTEVVALIKPQHEVGKDEVGNGGIVRDPQLHEKVVNEVKEFATKLGYIVQGVIDSPIQGATGNKEFLIYLLKPANL